MKKTILSVFCLLLCATCSLAQSLVFMRNYGPSGPQCEAKDVIHLPDGSILFVATLSQNAQEDIWLVKTNTIGDTLWTKVLGDTVRSERPESVILSSDNKLMIAGNSFLGIGSTNALLMCVDLSGNLLWERNYGGSGDDYANVIRETTDGFVMGGATTSSGAGYFDAWLLKINAAGDEQWSKTFGGAEYDDCWDLELTPEGGFMLTGGNYSFASGMYDDAWLVKADADGNLLWHKNYGVSDRVDWAWSLHPVLTGSTVTGYVFTGIKETAEVMPGAAYGNLHFVKVDLDGNVIWDKSIVSATFRKEGVDVKQLSDGGFMISGFQFSTSAKQLYMARTDANGNLNWDTSIGTNIAYTPRALTVATDGSCYTVGSVASPDGSMYNFMAKFDGLALSVHNTLAKEQEFTVQPNPATDHILLSWPVDTRVSCISFYDIGGRLLRNVPVNNISNLRIDLGGISAGPIIVAVTTAKGVLTKLVQHL